MALDASFWALAALVVFFGIVIYLKVPGLIAKNLDDRANSIRSELDEARKLREEAQTILAEYQRKRKEAESEAEEIVEAARHEAEVLAAQARVKTEEFIARRTAMAENKIAQAQAQALSDVKSAAVDMAIAAAQTIVADKVTGTSADQIIKNSIAEVKARLN
ncbi:MAG: F0F1 ATP synthase subunit B [Rhizobiaceae bacterium]|nr:F0F1 ATP synthase subunit B [Rhizobiaceae bacterium]